MSMFSWAFALNILILSLFSPAFSAEAEKGYSTCQIGFLTDLWIEHAHFIYTDNDNLNAARRSLDAELKDLLRGTIEGDQEAKQKFYAALTGISFRFLRAWFRHHDIFDANDALDLAQESVLAFFIVAEQGRIDLSSSKSLINYLLGICRHKYSNYRTDKNKLRGINESPTEMLSTHAASSQTRWRLGPNRPTADTGAKSVRYHPGDLLDALALKDMIDEAIKILHMRERQVFELRYLKGLTQQEVGAVFGISGARVGSIERLLLYKLQRKLIDLRFASYSDNVRALVSQSITPQYID